MKTILIIEDKVQLTKFITSMLEAEGWQVHVSATLKEGLSHSVSRAPDLILLDLGLPDSDGLDVINEVRAWSDMPIVILSARSKEQDVIDALNRGADDYITKPFGMGELLARLNAQLRRYHKQTGHEDEIVRFGNIAINLGQRTVYKNNEEVALTPIKYRLLTVLLRNSQRVLTHQQILSQVWGKGHQEQQHYVRVFMSNLRQKLEDDPTQPKHLLTEMGVGYRLKI